VCVCVCLSLCYGEDDVSMVCACLDGGSPCRTAARLFCARVLCPVYKPPVLSRRLCLVFDESQRVERRGRGGWWWTKVVDVLSGIQKSMSYRHFFRWISRQPT
jgi:hypothetical protein